MSGITAPDPRTHEVKYAGFEDARPLGLDMQRVVDACVYAKGKMINKLTLINLDQLYFLAIYIQKIL